MELTHPSFAVPGKSVGMTPTAEVRSFEVHEAEDEAAFATRMEANLKDFEGQKGPPAVADDPMINREVAKQDTINKLTELKKTYTKEVVLGGITFKMRFLKSNDRAYILNIMKDYATDEIYKFPLMTLAAAIQTVNDVPLEKYYDGAKPIENPMIRKYVEVCEWNTPVQNMLMLAYTQLESEVEQGFNKDFLVK